MERAIRNFTKFIADGNLSEAVTVGLAEAEASLKSLPTQATQLRPHLQNRISITPRAVQERMSSLQEILGGKTIEATLS